MNISRNSWHYRLADFMLDFANKSPSNSLCVYFWQVVLAPFAIMAVVFALLMAAVVLLIALLYGVGTMFNDLLAGIHILPVTFKQLPGIFNYRAVITSLLIDASIILWCTYKVRKNSRPKSEKIDEQKEQNFVFAFIKAKKQKICPFINFKD